MAIETSELATKYTNVPPVLRALKRHYGVSDAQIAAGVHISRQAVQGHLHSLTADIKARYLDGYAEFFGIPNELLYSREWRTVIQWLLDHSDIEEASPAGQIRLTWVSQNTTSGALFGLTASAVA